MIRLADQIDGIWTRAETFVLTTNDAFKPLVESSSTVKTR